MKKDNVFVARRRSFEPAITKNSLGRVPKKGPIRQAPKTAAPPANAFTLAELLAVIALLAFSAVMVMPALARTRPNAHIVQCLNNLRQLACGWKMYSTDNNEKLVSAYPGTAPAPPSSFAAWCYGNADDTGSSGSSFFDGTDPAGLEAGLLWPYIKAHKFYRCPADNRVAGFGTNAGKPILRSVSMNSCLNGRTYGDPNGTWVYGNNISTLSTLKYKIYIKQTQIFRPAQTFILVDEDPVSINDCMFIVDEEIGGGLIDLPSRLHSMGYGINFADGHAEILAFKNKARYQAFPEGSTPGHDEDTRQIHDNATFPLAPWPYKL